MKKTNYVLVTAAKNEEQHIAKTIQSVIAQTVLPKKWVIVSDGSADRTDEIAAQHASKHEWIEFLRMPKSRERSFASKVACFNAGYDRVRMIDFDIIGNLDADISFDSDYLEFLLAKFSLHPRLGIAGTRYVEDSYDSIKDSFRGENYVSGACQLFRRECYEEIGGYTPINVGGEDSIVVISARMHGWETRAFLEKAFFHHRTRGTAERMMLTSMFRNGEQDYNCGNHPLWQFLRSCYQMKNKPYVVGGLFLLSGYGWGLLRRTQRPVSSELVKFHRQEQMQRLASIVRATIKLRGASTPSDSKTRPEQVSTRPPYDQT